MCIFVTIVPGVVIISNTSCYLFKVRSAAGVLPGGIPKTVFDSLFNLTPVLQSRTEMHETL